MSTPRNRAIFVLLTTAVLCAATAFGDVVGRGTGGGGGGSSLIGGTTPVSSCGLGTVLYSSATGKLGCDADFTFDGTATGTLTNLRSPGLISGYAPAAVATTVRARATNVTTLTTAAHGLAAGQIFTLSGMTDTTFNGTWIVSTAPTSTTITFANVGGDVVSGADVGGTLTPLAVAQLGSITTNPRPATTANIQGGKLGFLTTTPTVMALAPPISTASTAGQALAINGSPATAGHTTAGAAAGGAVTITGGAAAQKTSGNADGGAVNLTGGAGIGTGVQGNVVATAPALIGATSTCAVGALGTANSVCLDANGITSEGTAADASQMRLAFGNHTADQTLTILADATGVSFSSGAASNFYGILTSGATQTSGIYAAADQGLNAYGGLFTYGSTAAGTLFGVNKANLSGFFADGSSSVGLALGTLTADPVIFGANNIEQMRLDSGAVGPKLVLQALTAATMTAENVAQVRNVVSSYTWSNAQVAALSGTAGDITVATLPAKTRVKNAYVVITGAAAGPATVTVSCGDANDGTPFIGYVVPSDAKAAANTVYGDAAGERGASIDTEFYYLPAYAATTLVSCHFISTGANLSTVTGSTGRVILETSLVP